VLYADTASRLLLNQSDFDPDALGGAALSVFPVVGNSAHDAVDEIADKVDNIPI
jgi:hypothetical protein